MSVAVSNLGYQMGNDWERPIRLAHYANMIARQKDLDRIAYNGELSGRDNMKADAFQSTINKNLETVGGGMGAINRLGSWDSPYRIKTNGGSSREIAPANDLRGLNANKYSVITNKVIDHNDRLHQIYVQWAKRLQANKGMSDPIQDPTSNYSAKKYMKY